MTDSDISSTRLSIERARNEAKDYGKASAVLAVVALVPITIVQAFALLGLTVTGWLFLFQGSTAISISLAGVARRRFQIAVVVVVPLLMSLYFLEDATAISPQSAVGHMVSPWSLLPIAVIACASWITADQLDRDHPFRGFLVACSILFIICYMGHNGIHSEHDDYTDSSYTSIDKEAAAQAAESGRYLGQYLVYVVVSYAAMLTSYQGRTRT